MTPTPTPEQPEDDRCPAKRVVLLGEYASAEVHCQAKIMKGLETVEHPWHTEHYMITETDGVRVAYRWSD